MRVAITGCASGIGSCVAAKLKNQGANITAFDLHEPTVNVDQWVQVDFNDPSSIDAALDATKGPFDALINNAGLPPKEGQTETVLMVNFIGLRQFSNGMLDKMANDSAIVHTASRAGAMWRENIEQVKAFLAVNSQQDIPAFVADHSIDHVRAYNLSKEAIIVSTFADCEALLARGIRVNSVSPAAVSTGILEDFKTAFGDRVGQAISRVGRAGLPEEVADLIVFLAGPESHWIKGQDITIDGGMTALAISDSLKLQSAI